MAGEEILMTCYVNVVIDRTCSMTTSKSKANPDLRYSAISTIVMVVMVLNEVMI